MALQYTYTERNVTARPRSKRLKELGVSAGNTSVSVIGSGGSGTGSNGDGHTHTNLDDLNKISFDKDRYLYVSQYEDDANGNETLVKGKAKSGQSDTAKNLTSDSSDWETIAQKITDALVTLKDLYISKVSDDTAKGFLKFLAGAEFGTFLSGLQSGTGARIDEGGNIEAQSIQIRGYAKFMEMIINRLQYVEGDYNFTENGTIEKLTANDDGTYTLSMRKRWDKDITAFAENDVVYGAQNNLLVTGEYYTSWFRVNAVVAESNSLVVSLYPDGETPAGKNFAPVIGMNVARRGNAVNEERQGTFYISSTERCIIWLEGVTKPIVEQSNYYLMLGRPKNLAIFTNLPINYKQSYIYARGAIIQDIFRVKFNGNPVYTVVDTGPWDDKTQYIHDMSDSGDYITNQCWHGSCAWQCAAVKATIGVAPRWNNTQWVCVSGVGNVKLNIVSSAGVVFRKNGVKTTLYGQLIHGTMDITDDVSSALWIWTRESTLADEDVAWNAKYSGGAKYINITDVDLPSNWATVKKVIFRLTVHYTNGQTAEKTFAIN